MLVITGTQRSGTTFISECMIKAGYNLGSCLYHQDISGGYENDFLFQWSGDKIKGFPFTGYTPSINSFTECDAIKWSFFMSLPFMLAEFLEEFKELDLQWLVLRRDTKEVYLSKRSKERFKTDHILLNQRPRELEVNFMKSLEILDLYKQKYIIIPFPLIKDSGQPILELSGLDIREQIEKRFDPTKIGAWRK